LAENNISGFPEYLTHLWKTHSSDEGVFGLQLSYPQYNFLQEIIPLEGVLGCEFRWFYLLRRNIVLQAVSLYIAHQTGIYHRYIHDAESSGVPDVVYNEGELRRLIETIFNQERAFERLFRSRGVEPVRLAYEEIIKKKEKTLMLFRNVLGISHEVIADDTASVKKLNYGINREFEERFCEGNKQYLGEILQKRILP